MRTFLFICFVGVAFGSSQPYDYFKGQVQPQGQQTFPPQQNVASVVPTQEYLPPVSSAQETIVSKHFYIHAAPDEPEEEVREQEVNLGPVRKDYRVVFIKAPVEPERKAALRIAQAQNEEKTAIYVLTKKTDPTEIRTAVEAAPKTPTKPEVFFIKYKTLEEAVHAQQQIQAQYDALGGTSQVSDEGYAPVTSVIGTVGNTKQTNNAEQASHAFQTTTGQTQSVGIATQTPSNHPQNPYLPPFPFLSQGLNAN